MTDATEITITRAEYNRLKWFENGMRRLWFFFLGIIPFEWVGESLQRLNKRKGELPAPKLYQAE